MKKRHYLLTIIAITLVSGIFTACRNPLVMALLRGPALLDNIIIKAVDASGNDAELNYGLHPNFTSDCHEYYVMIPRYTSKTIVEGISFHGAKVSNYKMVTASNSIDRETGEFYDFEYPEKSALIYLTVERTGMDSSVYILTVYRMMPAWINGIAFTTKVGNDTNPSAYKYPLSPGFNSMNFDYTVGVNYNAASFSFDVTRRSMFPGDENIAISYSLEDGTPVDPNDIPFPYDPLYPNDPNRTVMEKTVNLTVSFPEEDPNPVTYAIKVIRPSKVIARTGTVEGDENSINLTGEEKDYYFHHGEAVSFSVTPPFGYATAAVKAVSDNKAVELFQSGNTYSFIMPLTEVVVSAQWNEIPKATYTNVRYVWEHGKGDGSQWCRATKDLQKLIDGYTGVYPNDYEIWIAKGTISPNWTWIDLPVGDPGRPSWTDEIASDQTTWDHWAFVLKNGVKIYGGFAGTEVLQADKNGRNITANETILSGYKDKLGYTRHLVIAVGINQPTVLEGVTVTKSEAGGRVSNIKINGVILEAWTGAGASTVNCTNDLVFNRVTFSGNFTMHGAGVGNTDSSPVFRQCVFTNNTVFCSGAGIFNTGTSAPLIENCTITGNLAGEYNWYYGVSVRGGGGISHIGTGRMTVVNTLITSNFAPINAAGIYATAPVTLINVSIVKNLRSADLNANNAGSVILNTVAWGSSTGTNSTVPAAAGSSPYNRIQGYQNGTGVTITSSTILGLNSSFKPVDLPCKNGGDFSAYDTVNFPNTDLAGNPRWTGSTISIGAYQ